MSWKTKWCHATSYLRKLSLPKKQVQLNCFIEAKSLLKLDTLPDGLVLEYSTQ